jgi:hypothetical protein
VSIANGVVIQGLSLVFKELAQRLTEWENHRTDAEHENSFITKSFCLDFVNHYLALFYIGFVRGSYAIEAGIADFIGRDVHFGACFNDSCVQVSAVLVLRTL